MHDTRHAVQFIVSHRDQFAEILWQLYTTAALTYKVCSNYVHVYSVTGFSQKHKTYVRQVFRQVEWSVTTQVDMPEQCAYDCPLHTFSLTNS